MILLTDNKGWECWFDSTEEAAMFIMLVPAVERGTLSVQPAMFSAAADFMDFMKGFVV